MKHFRFIEFFPHCSSLEIQTVLSDKTLSNNLSEIAHLIDDIRDSFGSAIAISSGFRDSKHNDLAGGSPTSQHLSMCAIDIYACYKSNQSLLDHLCNFYFSRVGQVIFYKQKGIIHVALPTPKYPALTLLYK